MKKEIQCIEPAKLSKKCWRNGAWTISFVTSNKGNFVLKGFIGDNELFLRTFKMQGGKYIVCHTMYDGFKSRSHWTTSNKDIILNEPKPKEKVRKHYRRENKFYFTLSKWDGLTCTNNILFKVKRLPKTWIPLYNEIF